MFGRRRRGPSAYAKAYAEAGLNSEVSSAIDWFMHKNGITNEVLAERLGVSVGRVSLIRTSLRGDTVTLRTLAVVAAALGADWTVQLEPKED